jgi:hypothetical protein
MGRDDICSQQATRRGHPERTIVQSENLGAKRWGIGLGLLLGIVLACLSLTEIPFFGRQSAQPRRQSLPRPQNREARAEIDPFAQVAKAASPTSEAGRPGNVPSAPSIGKLTESAVPKTASSDLQLIPTARKRADSAVPSTTVLSPLVPPPRDLDESPQDQLKFAQFLIKARLAPMAAEPLRNVVKEAPGTSIAREAQHTLDIISRN